MPVKFRDACITRLQSHLGESLVKQTAAIYATPDGGTGYLALKAEALHLADRTSEALEAINEAETLAERFEQRGFIARIHLLRGVFLTAIGADETQIEASFSAAIRTAREQKAVSLEKRAEASYAEYHRQKANA